METEEGRRSSCAAEVCVLEGWLKLRKDWKVLSLLQLGTWKINTSMCWFITAQSEMEEK